MLFYSVLFLSAVLVGLPSLVWQLDVRVQAVHVEIGWFRIAGVVLFVACLAIYIYSSYLLSRHGRGAYVEFDPPRRFVSAGPYRWVRNPIVGSLLGMLLGEAVALSSTGVFLLFLASLPVAHLQATLLEEPLLLRRFGQAYAEYLARVPRWVPRRPREGAP